MAPELQQGRGFVRNVLHAEHRLRVPAAYNLFGRKRLSP
jgi:hypothetical protein